MARPKKNLDPEQIRRLAQIHCTVEEMAAVLDCSKRTLETRFCALIQKGKSEGRASLRRQQYKQAMSGDRTMLVWLGKQLLGQVDKQELSVGSGEGDALRIRVTYENRPVQS